MLAPLEWLSAPFSSGTITGFLQWAGGAAPGPSFALARWFFLRALGAIYLIAFLSFWMQGKGLIGSQGILPLQEFLRAVRAHYGGAGVLLHPTLFWINASDLMLHLVCGVGVLCAMLLILGIAPAVNLVALWVLYLSLTVAGQDFMHFQWDILLLEAGFLAIFVAPWSILPGLAGETVVPRIVVFLFWLLLFRLTFESGIVKLTSGDPTWRNFTALDYHYWTQPLPIWTAWFVAQLPHGFHVFSMVFMYAVELVIPMLIFGPPSARFISFVGMVLLQLLIFLTGNYNFFNLLTIALGFFLLNDTQWAGILPTSFLHWLGSPGTVLIPSTFLGVTLIVATFLILVGGKQLIETVFPRAVLPLFFQKLEDAVQPLRSVSSYGLFRVMTVRRPEIIVEGSLNGKEWRPYTFRYKPGDPHRRPSFVEPHQPRLDWQMWFAALGGVRQEYWFQQFLVRLLEGSPPVLRLLGPPPFPGQSPRFVRALLYEYHFTDLHREHVWDASRALLSRSDFPWWERTFIGSFSPVLSLREGSRSVYTPSP